MRGSAFEALVGAAIHNEVDGGRGGIGDATLDVEQVRKNGIFQAHES